MATVRNGFVPARSPEPYFVKNVPVTLNANQRLFLGDAVTLSNGNCVPVTAGQNPNLPGYGVVIGLLTTAGRPLTNQVSQFFVSGGGGRALVCTDPNMTYIVRLQTSAAQTLVGENVEVTAGAANTAYGRSGMAVDVATSADSSLLFKVIGLAPTEELAGKEAGWLEGAGVGVEVMWNRHINRAGTAAV